MSSTRLIKYRFQQVGNYVKISDISSNPLYYLPVNSLTLLKLGDEFFQFNLMGENVLYPILWTDVVEPDPTSFLSIDQFLDALAAIVNIPIGGGGGGGGGVYNRQSPSTIGVGGLPSGSSLTGLTWQELLEHILCPYIAPAFTSFTSSLFTTYEVGDSPTSGVRTVNYTVSNAGNIKVQPPLVGALSTTIPSATFPINPVNMVGSGSFQITIPANTRLLAPGSMTISMQGTNSQNNPIGPTSGSLVWRQRVFWGQSSSTSLTESEIKALQNNALRSGFAATYSFASGGYKWLWYPASMGTASTFTDIGTGFPVAMDSTVYSISVTNSFGVTETYRGHRTLNILGGSINIAVS